MAKKNWDRVRSQKPSDTTPYRDVYEDQQLERGTISEKQSPTSRIILVIVLSVLVLAASYFLISALSFGFGKFKSMSSGDPATEQVDSAEEINDILGPDWEQPKYKEDFTEEGLRYVDENGVVFKHEPTRSDYVQMRYEELEAAGETIPNISEAAGSEDEAVTSISSAKTVTGSFASCFAPSMFKVLISLGITGAFAAIMYEVMMRNLKAQNMLSDTSDINQYQNDQHIALPEEIQRKFDWFPDVGAHCNVQVSSMISHVMLSNKGINSIKVARRADETILDEDGDVEYYKGEVLLNDDGEPIIVTKPMFDEKFADALFEASGALDDKAVRKYYDATAIPYNPDGKDGTKQGGDWNTVAQMINHNWVFPSYEPQRPAGAYLVDTEPVNTMV